MVADTAKVTITTNRKSHMRFPLTPRSMTLGDTELLKGQTLLKFRDISLVSEAMTAKRMKIDRDCQQRNCSPLKTLQRCIDYVDITGRSSARGRKTRVRWQNKSSNTHGCRALTWRLLGFLVSGHGVT